VQSSGVTLYFSKGFLEAATRGLAAAEALWFTFGTEV